MNSNSSNQDIGSTVVQLGDFENREVGDRLPVESFRLTELSELSERFKFWIPHSLPAGVSVNVSSSRLGQKLEQYGAWFDALRTMAVQIQSQHKFLITAQGTTTDPFVRRIAELFEIPIVNFKPIPNDATADWFKHTADQASQTQSIDVSVWYQQAESKKKQFNVNDLLISIASVSVLLSVRKSGNIFAAANRRLKSQASFVGPLVEASEGDGGPAVEVSAKQDRRALTRILIDRKLTSKKVETELLEAGASGWWLYDSEVSLESRQSDTQVGDARLPNDQSSEPVILDLEEVDSDQFVLHWTRRRVGPWPDQTQTSYLDDLIFRNSRREHGELSALCRILASGRILGSSNLTRDRRSVVCFSDIPLEQLKDRRVFRSHLSRWDFEPYGLAIDRDLLGDLGARPVIYGNEATWNSLSPSDRPFFQPEKSASQKIDWRLEHEWRIIGDLRLELIAHDQALVFVASEAQANIVAGLCHWPIVVMGTKANE